MQAKCLARWDCCCQSNTMFVYVETRLNYATVAGQILKRWKSFAADDVGRATCAVGVEEVIEVEFVGRGK